VTHTAYVTNEAVSTVSVIGAAQPVPVTTATSSRNPSSVGQSVAFTAKVGPVNGGTVTFSNGKVLCRAVPLKRVSGSTYRATCATKTLLAGLRTITAVYRGDASYAASTGTLIQTVKRIPTALTASPHRDTDRVGSPAPRPARLVQLRAVGAVHPADRRRRRGYLRAHRPRGSSGRAGKRRHQGQLPRKHELPAVSRDHGPAGAPVERRAVKP